MYWKSPESNFKMIKLEMGKGALFKVEIGAG